MLSSLPRRTCFHCLTSSRTTLPLRVLVLHSLMVGAICVCNSIGHVLDPPIAAHAFDLCALPPRAGKCVVSTTAGWPAFLDVQWTVVPEGLEEVVSV